MRLEEITVEDVRLHGEGQARTDPPEAGG